MTMISVRIDDDLKKETEEVCNELGLNMTTAVTIFLKKLCREQRIPFEVSMYNEKVTQAIENALNGTNLSRKFHSVDELFEDLNDENDKV